MCIRDSRKDADDLADGIALPDGGQELVAEPLASRGAPDDAGDVDEGDHGRQDLLRVEDAGEDLETRVGHGHHAHVGLDGGEGVVRRQHIVAGESVEER